MKVWPVVSRVAFDLACDRANAAEERARTAEQRYADLVQVLAGMKRDGFGAPLPTVPLPVPERSRLDITLDEVAPRDAALRRHLRDYASRNPDNLPDDELLERLRHWDAGDDD